MTKDALPGLTCVGNKVTVEPRPGPMVVGDGDGEDLQSRFKKFREQKKAEKKAEEELKKKAAIERNSPQYKAILRKKFVETARKYLGVPYAKRFHEVEGCQCEGCVEKGESQFDAPLFLDCCALVRQCVTDLKDSFGFVLNKTNQVGQFDSLPIRVDDISELEAGDLIFYEGEYYSENAKPQGHNIVHVEIYAGEGEAVIGSRERFKWVKEYDSFRIENSKRWKLIRYHFCKIDPWLDGVYQNYCTEHPWRIPGQCFHETKDSGKKRSVFDDNDHDHDETDGDCD
mmetsp:Transcript_11970/g.14247  ORF Transcript_11970/g.14247 Transcript_11970/m.14247 type:complete len:285 (+) Transcript_11970:1069-1923(+)|eukprot:CAMPEP_0197844944 /NCGR_PEP_ID=MMETSP1438-20131217/1913_1 /TAXON_ID=1461541 /ORGANISM="Pterosperma sp., Strain CCMP1384" /LENGTH=284 /DNA_ID=CAMNT_0043455991 /DNA_START=276 /DNA_END=1130 /DNA_ORIENTATION=+